MTTENGHSGSPPPAHVIGKAFVEQYYNILHLSPEVVHKFYQDGSVLAHPEPDGTMSSVTTMEGINLKIMSLHYEECNFEIETVDAQHSFKEGVLVLVMGRLARTSNIPQKFSQAFFLAPQENGGFFVLNDVFRYVSESTAKEDDNLPGYTSPDPVSTCQPSETVEVNKLEDPSPAVKDEPRDEDDSPADVATSTVQEDGPKKSYASIVKVARGGNPAVHVATKTEKHVREATPVTVQEAITSPSTSILPHETSNSLTTAEEGHAVYARNLPMTSTPVEIEELFKKFGTIKPGGVQVRNHRQYGYCFGFIEYESENSVQAAVEASPLEISGQRVVVEVKRTLTRVGDGAAANGRGQFSQGGRGGGGFRGGNNRFRGDGFRGRGGGVNNNGGPQGYPRMEFRSRAAFPGQQFGRGAAARNGSGGGMISQAAVPA